MARGVWYSPTVFAKPLYSIVLLCGSLLAWICASFGGSSALFPFWLGAAALSCVAILGGFTLARGFHGRANLWCITFTILFMLWIAIRGALSEVKYLARPDVIFAIAAFISYSLTAGQFETVRERRWILWTLMGIMFANVCWGGYQHFTNQAGYLPHAAIAQTIPALGDKLGWTEYGLSGSSDKVSGFFISGNHFAGLIEMVALPALGFFLMSRAGFFLRVSALLLFLAGLAGSILSTSRAGQVCMLGGTLFVLGVWWVSRMRLGKQSLRTTLIVGGVATVVLLSGMVLGAAKLIKRQHGNFVNSNEFVARQIYSDLAWEQFAKRPFDGTGARSFEYEERAQRSLDMEIWMWYGDIDTDAVFTHNDWMQLLGDYGGIGAVLGLLMVGSHVMNGLAFVWRRTQALSAAEGAARQDDRLGLTLGALGAVVAMAVHSSLDFNLHIGFNAVVAATLLGFLGNPGREALKNSVDQQGDPLVPRQGIWLRAPMVAIALIGAGFILLHGPDWFRADRAMRLGERMRDQNNYFEATAALQEAITKDPNHYPAMMTLGLLNMDEAARLKENYRPRNQQEQEMNDKVQMSFLRRACEILEQAYPLYPQNPYLCMQLGSCFSERRDFESAELWFKRGFNYGKASRRLYFQYGQHLIRKALSSADIATQIELGERALNQYYLPARNKLRSGGEYQKMIDLHLGDIRKWLEDLKAAQKAATEPAPNLDPAPPVQ